MLEDVELDEEDELVDDDRVEEEEEDEDDDEEDDDESVELLRRFQCFPFKSVLCTESLSTDLESFGF